MTTTPQAAPFQVAAFDTLRRFAALMPLVHQTPMFTLYVRMEVNRDGVTLHALKTMLYHVGTQTVDRTVAWAELAQPSEVDLLGRALKQVCVQLGVPHVGG